MNRQIVIRSQTTGKYHKGEVNSTIMYCNYSGQARLRKNRPAGADEIAKAQPTSFCLKCFPNGKP